MNERKRALSLLNLISTPVPVLNSLGLETSIGLSSEDPVGGRHPSETYRAYLTIYSPDGVLTNRLILGDIPPHRRRFFHLSELISPTFSGKDHLTVVHRIPERLLINGRRPEDIVELSSEEGDYGMFRGVVQYSFPGQGSGNGSVIYETPHGLNTKRPGKPLPTTLTFTSKVVLSKTVNTTLCLMYYSMDPGHDTKAHYEFSFFGPTGERVATGSREFRPFTVELIDVKETIPPSEVERATDPVDGLSCFGFVGYSTDGVLIPLILNVDPSKRAVALEHSHPAQSYTYPFRPEDKQKFKVRAVRQWKALSSVESPVPV